MSYTHNGRQAVELYKDPIDLDATDWVFFIYEDWLRDNETIVYHSASVTGGSIVTDSVYIGAMTDQDGTAHTGVYGVQINVSGGFDEVRVTHRVSTSTTDNTDLGRLNIDHTVLIPIELL